jgi:hypothetical protein
LRRNIKGGIYENFTKEQAEEEFDRYLKNVTEDDVSKVLEKEKAILGKAHGPLEKFARYSSKPSITLFLCILKGYLDGFLGFYRLKT